MIKDGILVYLDFFDFETCVACIKGKLPAKTRKQKISRSQEILDLIHTDICGPISLAALGNYRYFIIFIDDYSRYGYIELIREKSDSSEAFKIFKAAVELQKK